MLYNLTALTQAELETGLTPAIGGELAVYMSFVQSTLIAEISLTAAGVATLTDSSGSNVLAAGTDLQIVTAAPLVSATQANVVIAGVGTATNPLAGTATFSNPPRSTVNSFNFQQGWAVDVITAASEKFKSGRTAGAITLASGVFTQTAHGMTDGTVVTVSDIGGTVGLAAGRNYYIVGSATNTFQLAATAGGTAIATGSTVGTFDYVLTLVLTSVAGGSKGTKYRIYQLPAAADWTLVGCTQDFNYKDKSAEPMNVPCGRDQAAFTKAGLLPDGTWSLGAKFRSFGDGLPRFAGQRISVRGDFVKDGLVTSDRFVLTNAFYGLDNTNPELAGFSMNAGTGKYADGLFFTAP